MKALSLLLFLALQLTAFAQNKSDKTPYITRQFANQNIQSVDVKTSGGSIYVSGVTAAESHVDVFINGNNSKELSNEEMKKIIEEKYDLDISVNAGKLTAIAKPKDKTGKWKNHVSISFRVYVPSQVSTDLATSGGSIHLNKLSGRLKFATSGGSLHLNDVSGNINGKTSGGSIHLENAKDEIELTTSGGSIHAKNCTGNLKLKTSGGSLDLQDLNGQITANTSGGSIRGGNIHGELSTHTAGGSVHLKDLACSVDASTSGGRMSVEITEPGKFVKIRNSSGNIDISLPRDKGFDIELQGKLSTVELQNFSGNRSENAVSGKLNGGGIPVSIATGSGKINLELR